MEDKCKHITLGIPVKICIECGKKWLTGVDTTEENEVISFDVVSCTINKEPQSPYDFFNVKATNVVYKISRN